ncbi:MAG: acyl-CoA dehydrogenase family protein, partial [Desulfatibacillaceae bacterium]|nr:acyl-CoA dehydrogenase family protein [Desulfatibacillaceae bacterium]
MEILPYTREHLLFRERIRDFCQKEVAPHVQQWEKEGIVDRRIWKKMGSQGFLCTWAAPCYGGMGGDFLYSIIALEEMAKTNHYGLDAFLHSDIVTPYIAAYGNDEQKEKYLPGCISGDIVTAVAMTEPDAGSDLASMTLTAEEREGLVCLNGVKTFISNGLSCDLVVTAARDPHCPNRHAAVSLYLVESGFEGFSRGRGAKKLGVHSQDTAELYYQSCKVPLQNLLGKKGAGFAMLMEKLAQERLLVAVLAACKARFALEQTIEILKQESKGPLSQAQSFALVEMSTEVELGRVFVERLVLEHMAGKDITARVCMAKYW